MREFIRLLLASITAFLWIFAIYMLLSPMMLDYYILISLYFLFVLFYTWLMYVYGIIDRKIEKIFIKFIISIPIILFIVPVVYLAYHILLKMLF